MPAPSVAVNRVVVALLDGTRHRGFVYNFNPLSTSFFLCPSESPDAARARRVEFAEVKAIFFVTSHEGNRAAREWNRSLPAPKQRKVRGKRMRIHFHDGEVMDASTEAYNPDRPGFFVFPLEEDSNNLRVFVVNANIQRLVTGENLEAELAAEKAGQGGKPSSPRPVGPPPPPPSPEPTPISLDGRVEAVLRILNGESAAVVSADTGAPEAVLSWWTDAFLKAGRAALEG